MAEVRGTGERREPVLLPGERGWDGNGLVARWAERQARIAAIGQAGRPVEVEATRAFPRTILILPLAPAETTGIDPATVRIFNVDAVRDGYNLLWSSGFAVGLGYAWATIERPGRYVAVGLPRDPVLRELIVGLSLARRSGLSVRDGPAKFLIDERLALPLASLPPDRLRWLRETAAADEAATSPDPTVAMAVRRGRGGGVEPFDLPGGMTIGQLIEAVRSVRPSAEGLLDEALVAISGPAPEAGDGAAGAARAAQPGIPATARWWTYHRDPQHTGLAANSHLSRTTVGMLRPRYRLPLDGPIVSVPAVVDNVVYVGIGNSRLAAGRRGGTLYAVDLLSGTVRTTFTFNTPPLGGSRQGMAGIACTPAIVDGRVYFSGLDGRLYCLDAATLTPIWVTDLRHADPVHNQPVTHQVNAEGWSSPLVVNGRVYVGCGESESNTFGFVYCLSAASGVVQWLFCTTLFPGDAANQPNVVPRSMIGIDPLPPSFRGAPDPPARGGSPWSSPAYDPIANRIVVGTGNVLPQHPLPQPAYSLGVLSLDANTGGDPRFFQPANEDNYRPDDSDVDVAASPLVYVAAGKRRIAIGSKNGSFFVLDADGLVPVARRQLLPRAGGNGGFPGDTGRRVPTVDPHPPDPVEGRRTENFYGIFSSAAVSYALGRLFVGVGGFAYGVGTPGIDSASTPFLRALDWADLTDAWATAAGPDRIARYVVPRPPMYTTPGEAGFSSPVVVNDIVFMSTSRPALYAFDAETGLGLWSAPGFGPVVANSFTLGPVVFGDYVVVGSANLGLLAYSL